MFRTRILLLIVLGLLGLAAAARAVEPDQLLAPEQAYRLTAGVDDSGRLGLAWHIADGYYLYRSKFKFASRTAGIALGEPQFPAGERKHDEFFGDMEIYRGHIQIHAPLRRDDPAAATLLLEVTVQGCADAGICFPPYKQVLSLKLPAAASPPPAKGGLERLLASKPGKGSQDDLLPPELAFHFIGTVKDGNTLRASWQIADGYYLYRDRFKFVLLEPASVTLGEPTIPEGQTKQEEEGARQVFYRQLDIDLPLKRGDAGPVAVTLQAKFQGCAEQGVCYPPMEQTVVLELPADSGGPAQLSTAAAVDAEQDRIADSLKKQSIWLVSLSFLGFGLLMAFSPCLFPMIPILSGIVAGHGHDITTGKAFVLSLVYVLAAAVTYAVFGIFAGLFGSNLQAAFQNPWIIGSFAALFVILSLSMFDFYTLQMPAFIQERVAAVSHRQRSGTLVGVAIMGSLSAIIVGPCMAAPLAGALIYIGQTGDWVLGGLALFSMGLGMGVPLMIIGTSAGKLLPKAGIWMNAVKGIFGVGMLAVAVSLLERIVPPALALFLWACLLIVPAVYLGALEPLPQHCSGWRKLWKGVGLVMLTYGVLLLIGVANNGSDPLQPLRGLQGAVAAAPAEANTFVRVRSTAELDRELRSAREQGRWALVDYYADWCTSCKEMERYTFGDPRVKAALVRVALIQVDVTGTDEREKDLLQRYNLIGPPATLFFGPDGQERRDKRLVGYLSAEDFLKLLRRVMA
jgi:thiol:disulfide interchange protein DsbD